MSKLITIIVLIILIIALPVTFYLLKTQTSLFSKASTGPEPQEIKITNLADNSFTISFLTTAEVPGFIQYGTKESLGETASDDRDQTNRSTHHITLKNLDPDTIIYYKINSGGKVFDRAGKPFQQRTAPVTNQTPPLPKPVLGKISNEDKSIPKEAIVYLKLRTGEQLSSYIRDKGNFLITLNNARTDNLTNYLDPKVGETMEVNVISEAGIKATKTLFYTGKNEPIETIILSKTVPTSSTQPTSLLDLVMKNFGKKGQKLEGDLNGDGVVNSLDFVTAREKKGK